MRLTKKAIYAFLVVIVLLVLYGCSGGSAEDTPPTESPASEIAVSASFQQEDGNALCDSTVRFSFGEDFLEQSLDQNGEAKISGLPRSGDWMLTVFDRQEQVQGGMTIFLSEGTVIDAATGEGGIGYITLRGDTNEVALFFVLKNDGSILCSLRLTDPNSHGLDVSQEVAHCGS